MEHKDLWGMEGQVPEGEHLVPLGEARVARPGSQVSIVTWSKAVHAALEAAELLAARGVDAEVIDLRTLWPWDEQAVYASVEKTGRLLVTHEAVAVSGFGAEIAASVAEHCFHALKAPVRRLAAPRVPVAYAPPLEDRLRVTGEGIAAAALELVSGP
jgi:pyruvate dehydrogenase E1 component beta subunit